MTTTVSWKTDVVVNVVVVVLVVVGDVDVDGGCSVDP